MTKEDLELIGGVIKDTRISLEKQIKSIVLKHGVNGKDADQEALEKSARDYIDSLNLKSGTDGTDGFDGLPGTDVDQEALEKSARDYIDSLNLKSGTNGTDGKDAVAYDGQDGRDGLGIDAPVWSDGVYRKGMIITHNIGQYFEALEDTAAEPSHSKSWKRVGTAGFRQTGGYKKDFDYQNGDMFTKDFSTFMFQNDKEHLIAARSKAIPGPKGDDVEVKKEIEEIKKDYNEQILELWAVINTLSEDKLS